MKLAEQLENYAITQEMADEARECKAEFKRLDAHIVELEVATWAAWNELNAIRARDGVPWTHQRMKSDIDETYFSQVVDALDAAF